MAKVFEATVLIETETDEPNLDYMNGVMKHILEVMNVRYPLIAINVKVKQTVLLPEMEDECPPPNVSDLSLYAWVGEDENGSGEVGLKQAVCPAGTIPMVSCKQEKMEQEYIVEQEQKQADFFGKIIRLCRFDFAGQIRILKPTGHVCADCGFETSEQNGPCQQCGRYAIVPISFVKEHFGEDWRKAFE